MVGNAETLEKAKTDPSTEESLPEGGVRVWRDFMSHLREKGMVIAHSGTE